MPKGDSFYEDHTNRLWASWERANALDLYDSEEEERHEQELQAMRRASWQLGQERKRRWQLLHPPKPPPSSDEEDDITFEELEDAVTQLDSTGATNWNSLTARTREPQRSHAAPVFYDSDEEARFEMEEQIRRDPAYLEKIASWRVGHPPAESAVISSMSSRETQRAQMADKARYEMEEQQTSSRPDPIDSSQQTERPALRVPAWGVELDALRPVLDGLLCSFPVRQHNPPMGQPSPPAWQFNQPRRKLHFSTKHGRRQHHQDLRRARANRKAAKGGALRFTGAVQPRSAFDSAVPTTPMNAGMEPELSRPTRPVVQSNSVFVFAPPTAPALTVPATSGVFVFGRSTLTGMGFSPSPSSLIIIIIMIIISFNIFGILDTFN
jgi:hypothetical protein